MLSELTNKEYMVYIHKEKMDFLRQRMGYLHAYAYKMTYDSISKNVFFISSERIGWPSNKERGCPTWLYEINDDIKISLWSNFCYGNSSAFYIRVFFIGLQLGPYSEFVTYRYAREADILNYTRMERGTGVYNRDLSIIIIFFAIILLWAWITKD